MAMTRVSTAAAAHVVQPRLDAPETTKRADLVSAAGCRRRERGDGVHPAHGALRHRQARRPAVVAGEQVMLPGVGDEVVLGPRLAGGIVLEDHRLVRHHAQLRHDGAGVARGVEEPLRRGRRRVPVVAAAADEEKSDVARHLLGRDDDEPVLPHGLLDLGVSQPLLRRQVDQGRRRPFGGQRLRHAPRVVGIGRGDVLVERRFRCARRGRRQAAAAWRGRPADRTGTDSTTPPPTRTTNSAESSRFIRGLYAVAAVDFDGRRKRQDRERQRVARRTLGYG